MKTPLLTLLLSICFCFTSYSQIKIGDNPQTIDTASVLELESTSHVLVITRVTTIEMEAIIPKSGGMVYNTDTECVHYYTGTSWINLCEAGGISNLTTDPLMNNFRSITITPNGDLNHIEVGIITGSQIQENSITGILIAENSITNEELAQNSVTTFQIEDRSLQAEDFANANSNQILGTDTNGIVSWLDAATLTGADADQTTITGTGTDTNPFTIASSLVTSINNNTTAIANNGDTSDTNEIQNISLNNGILSITNGDSITLPISDGSETNISAGNGITISGDGTALTPYLIDALDESATNELQDLSFNANILTLTNPATAGNKINLSGLVGDGSETIIDALNSTVDVTGNGTTATPYILTTTAINTSITKLESEQTTQDFAIALNTAKVGLTTAQETIINNTSGTNTGDQTASEVPVTLTATNYTAATQDLEAHLEGINTALQNTSVTGTTGSIFFAGDDGSGAIIPIEDNAELFWDNSSNSLGIGINSPSNKLHVTGAIRSEGLLNSSGSSNNEPSYRFNSDTNTGLWNPAADEISFVVGALEALRLKESVGQGLEIISEGSLELKEQLLDENGNTGDFGQILTATSTGTEWKSPQIVAMGKYNPGSTNNLQGASVTGAYGNYIVTLNNSIASADYIIQLTVQDTFTINFANQTSNTFDVIITKTDDGSGITIGSTLPQWFFTVSDF